MGTYRSGRCRLPALLPSGILAVECHSGRSSRSLKPTSRLETSSSAKEVHVKNPGVVKAVTCAAVLLLLPAGLLRAQAIADSGATDERGAPPFLPNPVVTVSTVPASGDQNPYGVAFVPAHFPTGGALNPGDVLVSNFNDKANAQGTGTTIMRVQPGAAVSVFFQGQQGLGLSTALAVLSQGLVVVGNLPTSDGTCATAQPGSLLVIDRNGNLLTTLTDPAINGPWDMTTFDRGHGHVLAFVSDVLNGTVVRLDLTVAAGGVTITKATQIASGYMHRCDPAALVVGPTGLVYEPSLDVLYVAATEDNKVFAVRHAANTTHDHGTGHAVYEDNAHLHGPLGLALAPNGDLLVANSDVINPDANQPSEIVEFTVGGRFVKQLSVDPGQGG
jgi:hypothetical protein